MDEFAAITLVRGLVAVMETARLDVDFTGNADDSIVDDDWTNVVEYI